MLSKGGPTLIRVSSGRRQDDASWLVVGWAGLGVLARWLWANCKLILSAPPGYWLPFACLQPNHIEYKSYNLLIPLKQLPPLLIKHKLPNAFKCKMHNRFSHGIIIKSYHDYLRSTYNLLITTQKNVFPNNLRSAFMNCHFLFICLESLNLNNTSSWIDLIQVTLSFQVPCLISQL